MKALWRWLLAAAAILGMASSLAQSPEQPEYPRFSQGELDSMLAPIALYPDSLLSQLLIAATYPRDVTEAAAWSRARNNFAGEQAVRAAANEPWDPSVKSLVAFPQVLAMMDEHMEWTERLGDAFMSNPAQVTETIQALRGRADQAGTLRSGEEMVIRRDYGNYVIEPAAPEVVHVPYYDPNVAYGGWWWPENPPMYWSPWPGYAAGFATGFAFGYGVAVGPGFWYTGFDWPRHYVRFHNHRPWYYRGHSRWHDHRWYSNDHRRNVRGWHWSGSQQARTGQPRYRNDSIDRRESQRFTQKPAPAPAPAAAPSAATAGSALERRTSPRVLPAAPMQRSYGNGQPVERGFERTPERQYVAPPPPTASQPLSRSVERAAPSMPYQGQPSAPAQVLQRSHAPVHVAPAAVHVAPAPAPVHVAPAPSPIAREPSESRAPPSEPRSEGGSRGGGQPLGRGGGRSQQN